MTKVIKTKMCSAIDFNLLSETEMFNIRGGAETDRPKSRPKEIMDWDAQSQSKVSEQSIGESGLLDSLWQWLQNLKK